MVVSTCPLLGGLSSFGVSFIGGFTVWSNKLKCPDLRVSTFSGFTLVTIDITHTAGCVTLQHPPARPHTRGSWYPAEGKRGDN